MPALQERVQDIPVVGFIEYCLRGIGQVVFMNSPITGLFILAAAWTMTRGSASPARSGDRFDARRDRAGLRSWRHPRGTVWVQRGTGGIGARALPGPAWDVLVIVWIIVLSALSSVLMGALAAVFGGAWGCPVHAGLQHHHLLFLVTALQIAFGRLSPLVEPAARRQRPGVTVELRETADAIGSTDAMAILNAIFRGIGQLFFLNSILAGVLIIAIAFCSRIAAGFALSARPLGCSPAWHSAPTA